MHHIYLDHAATTPLDSRVLEEMLPFLQGQFGNASSVHGLGRKARFAVEECRERIAAHLKAMPGEIVFTSGATEANNMALKGVMLSGEGSLVVCKSEHEAVLQPARALQNAGRDVMFLDPDESGALPINSIEAVMDQGIRMVSCMHANNEVGSINDIGSIGEMCQQHGIIFHSDAVQTIGLYSLNPEALQVDLMSASAHKFYGPKGIGFLYVRNGVELAGLIEGGSQERRRRGGTENVAGIVGMAKALDLAVQEREKRVTHLLNLRDRLIDGLRSEIPECRLTGPTNSVQRVPHIVHITFPHQDGEVMDGEMLILNLDMEGVYVSSGSACTSGAIEPSHVLLAMRMKKEEASAAVRFSIGQDISETDIDVALDKLRVIVSRMRKKEHV